MAALLEEKLEFIDTTEVHWSTGTILAIFFAASLISAVFFGLGYTFGRGTPKPASNAAAVDSSESTPSSAAGNSAVVHAAAVVPMRSGTEHASIAHASSAAASIAKPVPAVTHEKAAEAPTANAHFMVQVGAIGDRKDARTLVAQLRKKGFHAGIYPGKHDKFLHVQLGPFATEEQASAARHRVIANGYHAILKHAS